MSDKLSGLKIGLFIGGLLLALVAIITLISSMVIIGNGERGVLVKLGKVEGQLEEGLHFKTPFISKIVIFDVKEKIFEESSSQFSKDVQEIALQVIVNASPDRDYISEFYKQYGSDYERKIVWPIIKSVVKEVSGGYKAVDMITQREKMQSEIESKISRALRENHFNVSKVAVTSINFKEEFKNAVEAKVVAQQEAEKAKNVTVRIKEEANQKLIAAKAEAESIKIKSEALKHNKNLIELNAVEKWDGRLPEFLMSSDGSIPFILNVDSSKKAEALK